MIGVWLLGMKKCSLDLDLILLSSILRLDNDDFLMILLKTDIATLFYRPSLVSGDLYYLYCHSSISYEF